MNISLAITTFNRYDLTIKSCAQVINDPRIDDIVILDDCSTDGSFEKLVDHFKPWPHVRVLRQAKNRGMQQNKADAIGYAKNEYVIILDSDNVIGTDYIYTLYKYNWFPDSIICPSYARPHFDLRVLSGTHLDRDNVSQLLRGKNGDKINILTNCCNYFVHRDNYLKVYKFNHEMKATDTAWFNYNWMLAGNSLYVAEGLEYDHLVHDRSGFLEDAHYNMAQAEKLKKMMMAL